MSGSKTDYAENKVLDYMTGRAVLSQLTLYLALFTGQPGETGTTGELAIGTGNYSRKQLNVPGTSNSFGLAGTNDPADGRIANNIDVAFPTPSADWGNIIYVGIFDASTAGNLLMYSSIPIKRVLANDSVTFPVGTIVLAEG